MMTTINLRKFYTLTLTNMWLDSVTPSWEHGVSTYRGTPRRLLQSYRDFKRGSGGCNVAVRITDGDDDVSIQDLEDAISNAEFEADYKRQNRH